MPFSKRYCKNIRRHDAPLLPFTSILAMIGYLAPLACANFLISALLPGSCPPNCGGNDTCFKDTRTVLHVLQHLQLLAQHECLTACMRAEEKVLPGCRGIPG